MVLVRDFVIGGGSLFSAVVVGCGGYLGESVVCGGWGPELWCCSFVYGEF